MPYAIRIHQTGGPEVMRREQVQVGKPGPGQVLVRNTAIGLNFVDTYYRSGLYAVALPAILGSEGAGVVEAVGPRVRDFKPGDRVAYVDPMGAYTDLLLRPAQRLVKIPAGVSDKSAAAMMLKGLTAHYLLHRTYKVKKGDTILVYAAAGGVGQILCQWAKYLGAKVIGTVGSEAKVPLARKAGCKQVLVSARDNIPERVKQLTKGVGVPVVYDSIGKDTFMDSLDCLAPLGLMVTYGNASGVVPPFGPALLTQKGSLFLTRPSLPAYIAKREDLVRSARALFRVVKNGTVKIAINQTYALQDAAQAHRDLESRKTTGSTILLP